MQGFEFRFGTTSMCMATEDMELFLTCQEPSGIKVVYLHGYIPISRYSPISRQDRGLPSFSTGIRSELQLRAPPHGGAFLFTGFRRRTRAGRGPDAPSPPRRHRPGAEPGRRSA